MNGMLCCLTGVCCPAGSDEQVEAMVHEMTSNLKVDPAYATEVAKWIFKHFDLAPAGTLAPYRDAIVKQAKHAKQSE